MTAKNSSERVTLHGERAKNAIQAQSLPVDFALAPKRIVPQWARRVGLAWIVAETNHLQEDASRFAGDKTSRQGQLPASAVQTRE